MAEHVVAYRRQIPGGELVTVVPRLVLGLAREGGFADTELPLPAGTWRNELTGETVQSDGEGVPVREILGQFPVALLARR